MSGAHPGLDLGPWCTRCGSYGIVETVTIDPGHPIGHCRRNGEKPSSCGRVALTYSTVERQATFARLAARLATRRHDRHGPTTYTEPNCMGCLADLWRAAHPTPGNDADGMFPPADAPEGVAR